MKKNTYIDNVLANLAIKQQFKKLFNTNVKNVSFNKLELIANYLKNDELLSYLNELNENNPNIHKNSFDKLRLHIKLTIIDILKIDLNKIQFKSYDERVFLLFLKYKTKSKYNKYKTYASRVLTIDVLNLFPNMQLCNFTVKELNTKINKLDIEKINYLIQLLEN